MTKEKQNLSVEVTLEQVVMIFLSRLGLFLKSMFIIYLITISYLLFLSENNYRSSAIITSTSYDNSLGISSSIASQFGISLPSNNVDQKWVYPEIIRSKILLRKLLDEKFTTQKFGKDKPLLEILNNGSLDSDIGQENLELIALENLNNRITIVENMRNNLYTVSVDAFEANFAKELCNALISELKSHQKDHNKQIKSETKNFILNRINSVEEDLASREEKLKEFRSRNRRISNSPNLLLEEERLQRDVMVVTGVYTTLKQQLENTKIDEKKDERLILVVDYPEKPLVPVSPNKRLIVFVVTFFAIIVYVLYISFIIKIDRDKSWNNLFNKVKSLIILKTKAIGLNNEK